MSRTVFEIKVGQRFGRLTAVKFVGLNQHGQQEWLFKCDCGEPKILLKGKVCSGNTQSCGCLRRENTGKLNYKHGQSKSSRLYDVWKCMHQRCNNPNSADYKYYGAQGVIVCPQWKDFEVFQQDVGEAPSPDMSLDRIDPYGNYEPGNVRWATALEQRHNRRA